MPRLFICVEISEYALLKQIEKILHELKLPGVKPVTTTQLHITLKFLGETPAKSVTAIKTALSEVKFAPFRISLDGLGCFPNLNYIRVVWVGVQEGKNELMSIARQVRAQIDSLGFPKDKRSFSPHLTLARVKKLPPSEKQTLRTLVQTNPDTSFGEQAINSIILKKSTLTPKGPIYEDLFSVTGNKKK